MKITRDNLIQVPNNTENADLNFLKILQELNLSQRSLKEFFQKITFCIYCGFILDVNAFFCLNCGNRLQ